MGGDMKPNKVNGKGLGGCKDHDPLQFQSTTSPKFSVIRVGERREKLSEMKGLKHPWILL